MKAQIISIGNELLIGDTLNTNASWMGNFLTEIGFEVTQVTTIRDEVDKIKKAISESMAESHVVFCTGGLGPTHDDITKKAVADLFNAKMVVNEEVLEFVKSRFKKWNIPFSKSNYDQALVPENAEVLFNDMGSAPGMWFHENGSHLAVIPGVPAEMKFLMQKRINPKLMKVFGDVGFLYSIYIKTIGVGESTLSDEVLGDLSSYLENDVTLAFLPILGGVTLRLNSKGRTLEEAKKKVRPLYDVIYERAKEFIFGEGKDVRLEEIVGQLLQQKDLTIATAESCTGGLIADTLTNVPGSSDYVMGGIISYSNQVKIAQLGVSKKMIEEKGAVSKEVAMQMAANVAERLKTDIGISATGIAGPGGGSEEKPVGTVWIGYYSKEEHFALKANISQNRILNKRRTMVISLDIIRRTLLGIQQMPYGLRKHLN
ncbi:MAG: competence/damage-inducible protein A [Balneolaceae bacterium]